MAEFSIRVESILDVDSCEHVLEINHWIRECIAKAGIICDSYYFRISFYMGDLHCDCYNEDEFKYHALGQEISISNYYLKTKNGNDSEISFFLQCKQENKKNIFVSSTNKIMLSEIIAIMKGEKERIERGIVASPASVIINANSGNIGVISAGDNNFIKTKTEIVTGSTQKRSIWKNIWEMIVTNIIWVIIVAVILSILAILGITQPDWLKF